MTSTLRTLFTLCILLPAAIARAEDPKPPEQTRTLAEYKFSIVDSNDTPFGRYTLKAVEDLKAKTIRIDVLLTGEMRDRKIRIQSSVTYTNGKDPQPVKGTALTAMNDETMMTGEIWFRESTYGWSCKKLFDRRNKQKVDPPIVYERKNQARPEAPMLFQSAVVILGPRILDKDGRKKVTFVEFPDDLTAPELVTLKNWVAIYRQKTESGGFELQIREPADNPYARRNPPRPHMTAKFDTDAQPIEVIIGHVRLVPFKPPDKDEPSPKAAM